MDAHAHLLSLGWAGPGHSLDSHPHKGRHGLAYDPRHVQSNGNGLVKPLLISQKKNTLGVGRKAHEPAAGNEWWLKGFEIALSNIGKSESERTSGTATPELGAKRHEGKHAGLYGFFVSGGEMEGTIKKDVKGGERVRRRKKRKSDVLEGRDSHESHTDSDATTLGRDSSPADQNFVEAKSWKTRNSKDGTVDFENVAKFLEVRDRDEKRRRRKERANAIEEFEQFGAFFEARVDRKDRSNPDSEDAVSTGPVEVENRAVMTAEERRQRRKKRKAARKAKASERSPETSKAPSPMINQVPTSDGRHVLESVDAAARAKAERKAEKRRSKDADFRI